MSNTPNTNAVNIYIGSLGGFSADYLSQLISSSEITTSRLGGRLVVIRKESLKESFLINKLAKDILNQNSSPTICESLENLYRLSDKDVANRALPVRAATAFRDGIMWLCGTNAIVAEKLGKAKVEMKASIAKEIDKQTQLSIKKATTTVESHPTAKTPTSQSKHKHRSNGSNHPYKSIMRESLNHLTPSEVAAEKEKDKKDLKDEIKRRELKQKEIEAEAARREELDLLKREKSITEKALASLNEKTLKLEETHELETARLIGALSTHNPGSTDEVLLLQERAIAEQVFLEEKTLLEKQVKEKRNFLQDVNKELLPLLEIEKFEKEFDEIMKSNGSSFASTAPTTRSNSERSSPFTN